MKTAADLHATANAVNPVEDRRTAIDGVCETAAESGYFLAEFKRSEFLVSDFDHLKDLGYRITIRHGSIYVYWAEPRITNE